MLDKNRTHLELNVSCSFIFMIIFSKPFADSDMKTASFMLIVLRKAPSIGNANTQGHHTDHHKLCSLKAEDSKCSVKIGTHEGKEVGCLL